MARNFLMFATTMNCNIYKKGNGIGDNLSNIFTIEKLSENIKSLPPWPLQSSPLDKIIAAKSCLHEKSYKG